MSRNLLTLLFALLTLSLVLPEADAQGRYDLPIRQEFRAAVDAGQLNRTFHRSSAGQVDATVGTQGRIFNQGNSEAIEAANRQARINAEQASERARLAQQQAADATKRQAAQREAIARQNAEAAEAVAKRQQEAAAKQRAWEEKQSLDKAAYANRHASTITYDPSKEVVKPKVVETISPQKQAGHVRGTPQHTNRLNQNQPTSTFFGERSGERATQIASQRGTPVPGKPQVKEYDFGHSVGTGPNGGMQTRVRVHTDSKGRVHGHPSGPEN